MHEILPFHIIFDISSHVTLKIRSSVVNIHHYSNFINCMVIHSISTHRNLNLCQVKQGLHDVIYLTDSFVFTLSHCVNLKTMRHKSASFNRIVADKSSHIARVTCAIYHLRFYSILFTPISSLRNLHSDLA